MAAPIKPMYRANLNQCPKCKGTLVLVEKTVSIIDVNEAGIPVHTPLADDDIDIKYVCGECGTVYDVEKDGMHYMIKRTTKKVVRENKNKIDMFNPFYN